METEIEAKWLDIDLENFRKKLKSLGAELVYPERQMTRNIYDYPDKKLQSNGGWVRLRDEADKITLSYKQLKDRSVTGTSEVQLVVDNFNRTDRFLRSLGLSLQSTQQTKRESWRLGDIEIELDTWPWIPSFVEIEATAEADLLETAKKLNLDYSEALHGSVETAYQAVYKVTEKEINSIPDIKFGPVPSWLEDRRKGK